MKWNAFELVSPAIQKTKQRVLPFSFKEWLRVGFVGSLSGLSSSSGNFSGSSSSSSSNSDFPKVTFEQFRQRTLDGFQKYGGAIGFFVSIILFFSLIFSYISSVFSFIFIDILVDKKAKVNFSKQNSKGISLFLFRAVFSLAIFLIIIALVFPYGYHFVKGNPIIDSVGVVYIIFSIFAFIVSIGLFWFLQLFVEDFVTGYMYTKKMPAWYSWKETWKLISKNKTEVLVYWLGRIVVSLITGFILGIVILIFIIVGFLIGLIFAAIGYLFYLVTLSYLTLIILLVLYFLIFFSVMVLAILILLAPITSFIKYFQLLNFEKLSGIKLFRK